MEYIQFTFEQLSREDNEMLIAQLSEIGFEGFEEGKQGLSAFVPLEDCKENLFDEIISIKPIKYTKSIIK